MASGKRPAEPYVKAPVVMLRYIVQHASAAACYVYCVLRSFHNPKAPGHCFPSVMAIAERAGVPPRSAEYHLAKLRRIGALHAVPRSPKGRRGRRSNTYLFPFADRLENGHWGCTIDTPAAQANKAQ